MSGTVSFTKHAREELAKDRKTDVDAINVLRGGAYQEAEWENGAWRHAVHTTRMVVVIQFFSEHHLLVVTAWVKK